MRIIIAALPLFLAACTGWPSGSYVQSISDKDAAVLAPVIASYLTDTLPPGSAVAVAPAQPGDAIAVLLTTDLQKAGFSEAATGQPVQYIAAPMENGVLLRVSIAEREGASQYFTRVPGGLIAADGPLTVMTP